MRTSARAWAWLRAAAITSLLLCGLSLPAQAQLSPQVSLLTFAPGEVYWQRFGHNALLVRQDGLPPRVYNYGIFDFRQKNFFLNFARGQMLYRLDEAPLDWTLAQYADEGRWVVEQRLALSESQHRELAAFLAWNARPENADYRYDYFLANCSTKTRDAIDRVLGGQLQQQLIGRPGTGSFRSDVLRLMRPMPALMLGMDLGLGSGVDASLTQWQEAFIPERLMTSIREVRIDGVPLVASERVLIPGSSPDSAVAPISTAMFLIAGVLVAALLLGLHRVRRHLSARIAFAIVGGVYVIACGLLGSVLLLGWHATDHWGMAANVNALLLHPVWWLLLPATLRQLRRNPSPPGWLVRVAAAVTGLAALLAVPLAIFGTQPTLHWIALWVPPHLAMLAVLAAPRRSAKTAD